MKIKQMQTQMKSDPEREKIFCEKYSCWMFVGACLSRQVKKHSWGGISNPRESKVNHTFTYPECAKCEQGKQILAEYQKLIGKENETSG